VTRLCARLGVAAPGPAGHADLTELSKHIMIEQSTAGLNIEIVDQDGR
jgi:hypothetical protein